MQYLRKNDLEHAKQSYTRANVLRMFDVMDVYTVYSYCAMLQTLGDSCVSYA